MPGEFLDVLDPGGNAIGRIKERTRVHRDGDWHRTVHVWIINGQGSVIIQKRGLKKDIWPGTWDVSAAGHVVSGDTSRNTAVREVREELGLKISPLELRSLSMIRNTFSDGCIHDNEICDVFVVQRDISPGTCVIQKDEVAEVALISVDELEKRIAGRDPDFVPHPEEYKKLFSYLK